MATRAYSDMTPAHVSPPGDTLSEELVARAMTQKELAQAMGRPQKLVNEIVRGKKRITAETALQLQRVLGIDARIWLGLQTEYDLHLARSVQARSA